MVGETFAEGGVEGEVVALASSFRADFGIDICEEDVSGMTWR